jgi:beta-ribofuranosylaminobenzene 5'-phosphate synthase
MPAKSNVNEVRVRAAARLHLGFLDLDGGLGRKFGGLGLAIGGPCTRLTLARAEAALVEGPEAPRAAHALDKIKAALAPQGRYHLSIHEAIPAHAGLGSGTQLALAIAAAVRRLEDLPADPAADAALLERGARSGLGAGLFTLGGFIVDGGRGASGLTPPVVARLPFPPEWRALLVTEPRGAGLSGEHEREAFAALPRAEAALAGEACRRVLMQALPALVEQDIAAFGAAISRIQEIVGDYFAPAQGGRRFVSPAVEDAVAALLEQGAVGSGQSSWGPTGFAFVASDACARRICERARPRVAPEVEISVVQGLNAGARIDALYARIA